MRAWLEVDLDALAYNYQTVREKIGQGVDLIAVVKSDAYGHGLKRVAAELDMLGVDSFAVISLDEARVVRSVSPRPILIMGYLDAKEIADAIGEGFVLSLYDRELLALYERLSERLGKVARVHLKVETGLNRLGLSIEEATDALTGQHRFPHVRIEAIFSHLAMATDKESNLAQLRSIQDLLVRIQSRSPLLPMHLANSHALADFPEGYFDAVRVGLALYGVDEVLPGLKPTLACKSVVMQVKNLAPGDGVSYDHQFIADKNMTIGVIAIGYGEGYTQALSGKSEVLIRGKRSRVLGKICMNMCVAELTDESIRRGDEVVLIGSQKSPDGESQQIRVTELAKWSGLRHHEIITRLGTALPKLYLGGGR